MPKPCCCLETHFVGFAFTRSRYAITCGSPTSSERAPDPRRGTGHDRRRERRAGLPIGPTGLPRRRTSGSSRLAPGATRSSCGPPEELQALPSLRRRRARAAAGGPLDGAACVAGRRHDQRAGTDQGLSSARCAPGDGGRDRERQVDDEQLRAVSARAGEIVERARSCCRAVRERDAPRSACESGETPTSPCRSPARRRGSRPGCRGRTCRPRRRAADRRARAILFTQSALSVVEVAREVVEIPTTCRSRRPRSVGQRRRRRGGRRPADLRLTSRPHGAGRTGSFGVAACATAGAGSASASSVAANLQAPIRTLSSLLPSRAIRERVLCARVYQVYADAGQSGIPAHGVPIVGPDRPLRSRVIRWAFHVRAAG